MSESTLLQELLRTISVPNMNVLLLKYTIVRTSGDEPKQFLGNTSPENTFRRQDGNDIVAKTVSHGRTELGNRTGTRTCCVRMWFDLNSRGTNTTHVRS